MDSVKICTIEIILYKHSLARVYARCSVPCCENLCTMTGPSPPATSLTESLHLS